MIEQMIMNELNITCMVIMLKLTLELAKTQPPRAAPEPKKFDCLKDDVDL